MSRSKLPIVVLLSGTGRSLRNLIERIAQGTLDLEIKKVISSRTDARGLEFAREANIPTAVVRRTDFSSDDTFGNAVFAEIPHAEVRYVVMAGFMCFLPIPANYENRVINIHPSLIPAFCGQGYYGHHVHEAVIKYGAKVSGCTVHFVDNEYDHGPILLQVPVELIPQETAESLAARVFAAETDALPHALQLLSEDRVRVNGRTVEIVPAE